MPDPNTKPTELEARVLGGGAEILMTGSDPTTENITNDALAQNVGSEFEARSLAGGTEILMTGSDPTTESITKYALAQGIDPEIMNLLMSDTSDWSGVTSLGCWPRSIHPSIRPTPPSRKTPTDRAHELRRQRLWSG